jgi:hypothetical protein
MPEDCLRYTKVVATGAGISKPGSVAAKEATGRIPLTALTKIDDE